MTTQRPDPRIGTDLGPYRIESVIGRGGMGVVYLATHSGLDRRVALKLLTPDYADDEAFRARFLRESKLAASIDHPNIIPVYDAGEIAGTYYIAMRYVEGTDLQQRLREGPLEPRSATTILTQVASALDAAHAAGLVHRDVKPANILIAKGQSTDGADHAYLTDFGLTRQRGSQTELTQMGGFLGTLDYIAPEQIEGKAVDGRADQYALAAVAVAALTGSPAFVRATDVALISAHLHDTPPSLHERDALLPVGVDAVIAGGLAKAPDDRYPDCRTFVDDLRAALGVTTTQPRPRPARGRELRPFVIVGVLVVALLAVAAFAFATGGLPASSASPSPSLAAASPTASSPPTEDLFPNEAEVALLDALPEDLQSTCQRGRYNALESNNGSRTPIASLECVPGPITGASSVLIRSFGSDAARNGYPGGVISLIGGGGFMTAGVPVPPGDCAVSRRANGRWLRAGADVGAILCFTETSTGDADLWWTYDADAIVVKALNQRGDSAALYDWFEQNARFIAP